MGLVLTSDEGMPRSRNTAGLYVETLGKLLDDNRTDDACRNRVHWLSSRRCC